MDSPAFRPLAPERARELRLAIDAAQTPEQLDRIEDMLLEGVPEDEDRDDSSNRGALLERLAQARTWVRREEVPSG